MAGVAAGGPLLSVRDLLRDLSDQRPAPPSPEPDSPTAIKNAKIAVLKSLLRPSNSLRASQGQTPDNAPQQSYFEGQELQLSFERTYNELTEALAEEGHAWTGLTDKLCTALTTADKLVATTHIQSGPLLTQVRSLQALVDRGHSALIKLETSIGQRS